MLDDKYMCWEDNSWQHDDVGSYYHSYWNCVFWATWQRVKHTVLLHEGKAASDCTHGTCIPVNFTVLKPSDWTQGHVIGIRRDGKGLDPRSLMYLKLVTVNHESSSYKIFHSFYEEIRSEFSISAKVKNFFFSLSGSIAQTLNVTSCYVCGGTNMEDHWSWEARELSPKEPFNDTAFPNHRKSIWLLQTSIIGNCCISHPEGQLSSSVGDLTCLGQKFTMILPKRHNDGELQTTQNPSPTHWPTFLISREHGTILP
jgi:hypothetical protein